MPEMPIHHDVGTAILAIEKNGEWIHRIRTGHRS